MWGSITNSAAINPSVRVNTHGNRVIGLIDTTYRMPTISNNFFDGMLVDYIPYSAPEDDLNDISKTIDDFKNQETCSSATTDGSLGCLFGENNANPWTIDADKNNGLPYLYW